LQVVGVVAHGGEQRVSARAGPSLKRLARQGTYIVRIVTRERGFLNQALMGMVQRRVTLRSYQPEAQARLTPTLACAAG
jgi:hypothetical protein